MDGYRCHEVPVRMIPLIILLLLILPLLVEAGGENALKVRLTVKENAGVGAAQYPVSAVVPLPRGRCSDLKGLGIAEVPSQVEVLERWPGDQSLRHVLVQLQPGKQQTMNIAIGNASRVYAAIFTFDKQENMSPISNVARAK
jgi:hypothetical protein